jgi:ketosteroid isomerase-like protein
MRSTLALCLLALVLSACGAAAPRDSAEDFSGAERAVAAAVEDIEEAARENDADRMCTKLLSPRLLASIKQEGITCTTAVREAFDDASSTDLTVDDISISGATATAKVTSGAGSNEKTDTLALEKAGAGWKISALKL